MVRTFPDEFEKGFSQLGATRIVTQTDLFDASEVSEDTGNDAENHVRSFPRGDANFETAYREVGGFCLWRCEAVRTPEGFAQTRPSGAERATATVESAKRNEAAEPIPVGTPILDPPLVNYDGGSYCELD
jgi:hypothetical protein